MTLIYIVHFLFLASAVTGGTSISNFASLLGISIVITSYVIRFKNYAKTARIKKYKARIKKK